MITFLPVKSFVRSMEFLDQKRLGRQRIEAAQILEILLDRPILPRNLLPVVPFNRKFHAWDNSPAVLMWKNHAEWLKLYLTCAIGEWVCRGYANNIAIPSYDTRLQNPPVWLGLEELHQSHRSNLIRKFPSHYRQFWPEESAELPYFWPANKL